MGICEIYLLSMGAVILGDLAVLFFAPKFIKARTPDQVAGGGEAGRSANPLMILRAAILMSILLVAALFLYLLSQEGCLG